MVADSWISRIDRRVVDACPSTNTLLSTLADARHGTVVTTPCQSAGRGQRGNSWEAAPGLNITASMLLLPGGIEACRAFSLSEAAALAVRDTVAAHTGADISVKWPNDIYAGDSKVAGILIENSLEGRMIRRTIVGIGLNVNQRRFVSDAPNPVSMAQLSGATYALDTLEEAMWGRVLQYAAEAESDDGRRVLHRRYLDALWRREGEHPWRRTADGAMLHAAIADIRPEGTLMLRTADGMLHPFAFKQVEALL